jgi:hypothetical protein
MSIYNSRHRYGLIIFYTLIIPITVDALCSRPAAGVQGITFGIPIPRDAVVPMAVWQHPRRAARPGSVPAVLGCHAAFHDLDFGDGHE